MGTGTIQIRALSCAVAGLVALAAPVGTAFAEEASSELEPIMASDGNVRETSEIAGTEEELGSEELELVDNPSVTEVEEGEGSCPIETVDDTEDAAESPSDGSSKDEPDDMPVGDESPEDGESPEGTLEVADTVGGIEGALDFTRNEVLPTVTAPAGPEAGKMTPYYYVSGTDLYTLYIGESEWYQTKSAIDGSGEERINGGTVSNGKNGILGGNLVADGVSYAVENPVGRVEGTLPGDLWVKIGVSPSGESGTHVANAIWRIDKESALEDAGISPSLPPADPQPDPEPPTDLDPTPAPKPDPAPETVTPQPPVSQQPSGRPSIAKTGDSAGMWTPLAVIGSAVIAAACAVAARARKVIQG